MESGIYVIKNTTDGKVYVGSSININQRKYLHFQSLKNGAHHSVRLQRAWDKHGSSTFSFLVLEIVGDRTQLILSEQKWIDRLNAYGPDGYNMVPNAGSNLGFAHSEQTKQKIAAKATGRPVSDETRAKMSASSPRISKPLTEEQKKKISDKLKGRLLSAETKLKIGEASRGRVKSPEELAKLSSSMKGKNTRKHTKDHCAKISESLKGNSYALGYKHSDETRAKVSMAGRGRIFSTERNAAISEKLKGRKKTPEHIAKLIASRWGESK
jgi:group I intron endonuclease